MLRVKGIVKELNFERNKVHIEIKVLGIATYIQTSVKDCKELSELHSVLKHQEW